MIVCAGDIESFEFARPIGIGLVNSAINLTELILTYCPAKIIFVGTAGSYGSKKIFDIVHSSGAANIELSFLLNKSFTPIDNVVVAGDDNHILVNSSNYITTDFVLAKEFEKYNLYIENMEFYAVVSCAKKFNIAVEGFFVITNYCNNNAHIDFISNHEKAKKLLCEHLITNKIVSRET